MKILESYKKMAKSMIVEHAWDRKFGEPLPTLDDVMREASQDDEDYVHIGYGKYKDKDHVDDPTAPTFKKDDSGAFVPSKGGDDKKEPKDDKEEPKGKGLGKGDFERDLDGDEPEDKPEVKLPDIMTKNIGKGRKRKENPESWDDVKAGDQYLHANGAVIQVVQRSASGNRIQAIIHPNPEHTSPSGGKRKKRTVTFAKPGKSQWKPGFNPSGASIAQLNKNRIIPIPLDAIKGSTEHDPEYKREG